MYGRRCWQTWLDQLDKSMNLKKSKVDWYDLSYSYRCWWTHWDSGQIKMVEWCYHPGQTIGINFVRQAVLHQINSDLDRLIWSLFELARVVISSMQSKTSDKTCLESSPSLSGQDLSPSPAGFESESRSLWLESESESWVAEISQL